IVEFTHCISPSPVLRDAHAEQAWVCQEDVRREPRIVTVQEVPGDGGGIEDVLQVTHHLPAILVGKDERKIQVGIAVYLVVGPVIEHARETVALPVEVTM